MPLEQHPTIAAFYAELLQRLAQGDREPRTTLGAACELVFGVPVPRELRELLAVSDEVAMPYSEFAAWDMRVLDGERLPATGEAARGNVFERLVFAAQQDRTDASLGRMFTACIPIGRTPAGESLVAHIDDQNPDTAAVLLVERESGEIVEYVADALSSLAWLCHQHTLYEVARALGEDDAGPTVAKVREALALLDGRVTMEGPFRALGQLVPDWPWSGRFIRPAAVLRFRDRSAWIISLLRGEPFSPSSFRRGDHARFDAGTALARPNLQRYPPTALYWQWRSFFLREDATLAQVLTITRMSPSPVVRDSAALVSELLRGRRQVGMVDVELLRDVAVEGAGLRGVGR